MRRNTPKRAARDREAKAWRQRQVELVGRCENCGHREALAVHEISRGYARGKAQDCPAATLVLCNTVPWREGCHNVVDRWPRAKQLALLYMVRPGEYDLAAYNALVTKGEIQEEVDWWIDELTRIKRR